MPVNRVTRRHFIEWTGIGAGSLLLHSCRGPSQSATGNTQKQEARHGPADYTLRIGTGLVELGKDRIISTTTSWPR